VQVSSFSSEKRCDIAVLALTTAARLYWSPRLAVTGSEVCCVAAKTHRGAGCEALRPAHAAGRFLSLGAAALCAGAEPLPSRVRHKLRLHIQVFGAAVLADLSQPLLMCWQHIILTSHTTFKTRLPVSRHIALHIAPPAQHDLRHSVHSTVRTSIYLDCDWWSHTRRMTPEGQASFTKRSRARGQALSKRSVSCKRYKPGHDVGQRVLLL
jgi:hypothetical protein